MAKLSKGIDITLQNNNPDFEFYCLGCKCSHGIWTSKRNDKQAIWSFNGDIEKPTITPSILVRSGCYPNNTICHSFINNGMIQYLSDCTHSYKGQTIELPNVE